MAKQVLILLVIAAAVGGVYFFLNYEIQTQYAERPTRPAGKSCRGKPAADPPLGRSRRRDRPPRGAHPHRHLPTRPARRGQAGQPPGERRAACTFSPLRSGGRAGRSGKEPRGAVRLVEQTQRGRQRPARYDFATCPTQADATAWSTTARFCSIATGSKSIGRRCISSRIGWAGFASSRWSGSFRVRGPDPAEAFTFTLINVETDPEHTAAELDLLAAAYRAVRDDRPQRRRHHPAGRSGERRPAPGPVGQAAGVSPLLSGVPTTVRGTQLLDNILLDRRATCEFTGRVEVVDLLREFELTMPGASEISEHLPVWAEFSAYEGGQAGHVAPPPSPRLPGEGQ